MTEEGKAARSKGRPKTKTSGPSAIWCEESVRELFRLKYSEPLRVSKDVRHRNADCGANGSNDRGNAECDESGINHGESCVESWPPSVNTAPTRNQFS
ncbi:hypothetical protein Ae201684P_015942 [Aphanomyces euteiches]|nr:hypothetical protein Ae201684P_015942 [Aphanomyces euteiches]